MYTQPGFASDQRLCRSRSRLRNDLYCVEWGVKLYSLTHFGTDDVMATRHLRHCEIMQGKVSTQENQ